MWVCFCGRDEVCVCARTCRGRYNFRAHLLRSVQSPVINCKSVFPVSLQWRIGGLNTVRMWKD